LQQIMVFSMLSFVQLGNALVVRSLVKSVIQIPLFRNSLLIFTVLGSIGLQLLLVYTPLLQPVFKTEALPWDAISLTAVVSIACVAIIESTKLLIAKISAN